MTPKSILAAVFLFLPAPALAQSIDASGVWTYTPGIEPHPVSEDLVVLHISHSHDRFEPASPDNPAADATGNCFGSMLVRAGQASGSGNCHYVDGDGDMLVTEWTVEGMNSDLSTTGRWAFVGGNGKWSAASGSGTYRSGQDESGAYKTELTGELTLN